MTRLVCLVAVLLVGSAWQCLADEHADTALSLRRRQLPETAPDAPEALRLADVAKKLVVLAESAYKLTTGAAKQFPELRARAETAVNATRNTAAEAKKDSVAAQDAQMAAEVAQELYGNATANPLLIEEHGKWFRERREEIQELRPTLDAAVKALEENKRDDITEQLITDVVGPARGIFSFAQDAEYDVKYIAKKRLYTEMLAERVEFLHDLAKRAKDRADKRTTADNEEPCTKTSHLHNATDVSQHRHAAAKAYLYAFSAQKIAAKCDSRISKNATKVDAMYYEVKKLLAKVLEADYNTMRVHHSIANEAHTNAVESRRIAASTSENAALYMKEAKSAADSITSCVDEEEARWYARMAHKASYRAMNEMHFAMYQLFSVTLSLQQMTDAKLAVKKNNNNNENTETDESITDPKDRAIDNEKKAEASYIHIKADADEAFDKLHRAQEISKQMRHLAAHHGSKIAAAKIEEQLHDVKAAVHAAKASRKQAQKAASSVDAHYEDAKAAADSALRAFAKADVEKFERAAAKAAIATQESQKINGLKVKAALGNVTEQEIRAVKAYEEAQRVVAEANKQMRQEKKE